VLFCHANSNGGVDNDDEDVEFEVEGGQRTEEEKLQYDELNDVDGGGDKGTSKSFKNQEELGLAFHLAANGNALRAAFILHAETTIVSVLNLIFYRGIPPSLLDGSSGSGDDVLLSLMDYCARQLIFLGMPEQSNPALAR